MSLPNTLKELQELCEKKILKFKGKTKSQLKHLLSDEIEPEVTAFEQKSVKELKEMCDEKGIAKVGNKATLRNRLESLDNESEDGLMIVKWNQRGRKVASKPSEDVDNDNDSDDENDEQETSKYKCMKKNELRKECMSRNLPASGSNKVLVKRLVENDDIARNVPVDHHDKLCESCELNPRKLHKSSISKWFCTDCNEYISHICKDAHDKLRITRTHEIRPYGTILELNIPWLLPLKNK